MTASWLGAGSYTLITSVADPAMNIVNLWLDGNNSPAALALAEKKISYAMGKPVY